MIWTSECGRKGVRGQAETCDVTRRSEGAALALFVAHFSLTPSASPPFQ